MSVSFAMQSDSLKIWKSWERVAELPFSPRDGVGVVRFKEELWMLGGWAYGPLTNEIYKSLDGLQWEKVGEGAWEGRHCAGMVVLNNKIWVFSGDGHPDIWSSDDGINWILEVEQAPWGKRYAPYVTVYDDKIWLMGGVSYWDEAGNYNQELEKPFNDVWSSADGVNWELINKEAPWGPRGLIHGSLVHRGEMWVLGGGSKLWNVPTVIYNDVWKSRNGIDWELVTEHAPWDPRIHFTTISFDDKIWVIDGTTTKESLTNEAWYSEDGKEWFSLSSAETFPPSHASTVFVHDNALYLSAGYDIDAIYRYRPPQEQFLSGDSTAIAISLDLASIELDFTLSSGLEPVFYLQDTSIAEVVSGQELKIKNTGKTKVGVYHPGAHGYYPTDTIFISLSVKRHPNVFVEVPSKVVVNNIVQVNTQSDAGLPVRIIPGNHIQVVDNNSFIPTTTGMLSVELIQEGNDHFYAWNHTVNILVKNLPLMLYPNPAHSYMKVYAGNEDNMSKKIIITSVSGAVVKTLELPSDIDTNMVDIKELDAGVYTVRVVYANGTVSTTKFIKE